MRKENILHLFLNKCETLIQETRDILVAAGIDLGLLKLLLKVGANLTAVDVEGKNCAMNAAYHMSPNDYHELVQFLLTDCTAGYLFFGNDKWKDQLPYIIKWASLLPETLDLLLNVPGIDINMKIAKVYCFPLLKETTYTILSNL